MKINFIPGYWNIDTYKIRAILGVLTNDEDNPIANGTVQLQGRFNSSGSWKYLALPQIIEADMINDDNNIDIDDDIDDYIEVDDIIDDIEQDGFEEIPDIWDATVNGNIIEIRARIFDAAGNNRDWPTVPDPASTIEIHGITAEDRPKIVYADAVNENGWWGPHSDGLPIQIRLTADEEITVVTTEDGIPFIRLTTGPDVGIIDDTDGIANYASGTGTTELVFNYNPGVNEESDDLAFELTDDEAIIDLNDGDMYSIGGNRLKASTNNTDSPVLPMPADPTDDMTSLDESKDLIIDGVPPENLSEPVTPLARGGTALVRPPTSPIRVLWGDDNYIYWNSTHTQLSLDITLPLRDGLPDNSLASDADHVGSIQLKIKSIDNDEFQDLGSLVEINFPMEGTPPIQNQLALSEDTPIYFPTNNV